MDRREFLGAALAGAALGGCGLPAEVQLEEVAACQGLSDDEDIFRVDIHCHLINQDDVNGAAFIARRFLPDNLILDGAVGVLTRSALSVSALGTDSIAAESRKLGAFLKRTRGVASDPERLAAEFCAFANSEQRGLFLAGDSAAKGGVGAGRFTGFASTRMRNAAIMMALWPKVDVFTPLMVDLYEGARGGNTVHPIAQAEFYRMLNVASRGRFLPMVSFNPEREVLEGARYGMTNLDLVKRAIDEWGFVGVKMHPSAGFNPIDNERNGCPNTALQRRAVLNTVEGRAYDKALERLYEICDERDVPIMTHGSDGLSSHVACMNGRPQARYAENFNRRLSADDTQTVRYRDPEDWTNAPQQWSRMLDANSDKRNLRVALAHYASRFPDIRRVRTKAFPDARPYPKVSPKVEYDGRDLKPSVWLQGAMDRIEGGEDRLWLDLSHMTDLAYSAASGAGLDVKRTGPFASKVDDGGRYAEAFRRHLADNPYLHDRVMYGTDYHMPEISRFGALYRELIEDLLPDGAKEPIMGLNAARYLGLARTAAGDKPQTRQRLETFYAKQKIGDEVRWTRRLDERIDKGQSTAAREMR